jgi:hypothetical protein
VEAIYHLHVVRVQPAFIGLPDHLVHVSGVGGEDAGVVELEVVQSYAVFGHS